MNFVAIVFIATGTWLAWQVILGIGIVVKRWRKGMFKPAVFTAVITLFFAIFCAMCIFGAWQSLNADAGYQRAGAEDVVVVGSREGFENPLLAYTDADTGKLCVGEKVGGDEYVREIECIDPPKQDD
jgi:hypothetical protein